MGTNDFLRVALFDLVEQISALEHVFFFLVDCRDGFVFVAHQRKLVGERNKEVSELGDQKKRDLGVSEDKVSYLLVGAAVPQLKKQNPPNSLTKFLSVSRVFFDQ